MRGCQVRREIRQRNPRAGIFHLRDGDLGPAGREGTNGPPAHFCFCAAEGRIDAQGHLGGAPHAAGRRVGIRALGTRVLAGTRNGFLRCTSTPRRASRSTTASGEPRRERTARRGRPDPGSVHPRGVVARAGAALRTAEQFGRFVGETVFVETVQASRAASLQGALTAAGAETVEVEVDASAGRCRSWHSQGHLAPDV